MVSGDGLCSGGVSGLSVRFAIAYVRLRGDGMMEERRKERWGDR